MKWVKVRDLRGLVFDVENAPSTYGGGDYVHPKITAIGCKFLDDDKIEAWCLPRDKPKLRRAYAQFFADVWEQADFVIGHYARKHDVKLLNGLYASLELPLLPKRKLIDTLLDQPKMRGFSRGLDNYSHSQRYGGCPIQKLHMSEWDWEQAYDGIPAGVEKMRQRVITDVQINEWLYGVLLERGLLKW